MGRGASQALSEPGGSTQTSPDCVAVEASRRAARWATQREEATATQPGKPSAPARAASAAPKPASERNSEATPEASSSTAASLA